uniref:DISC1 scaffold protein n=2 Tax=Varanus komodoensis TaxID=61221 RepID=A0A8D2LSD2_VARKO
MRTEALQQIEFQLPSDCEPFSPEGLECRGRTNYRDFKNCSQKRQCKTELGLFHCSSYMNSTQAGLDVAPGLRTAGNAAESLTYQANLREQQPENLILPVCPLVAVCKGDPSQEEERMHTLSQKEVNIQEYSAKESALSSSSSQDCFHSSFSFIQLSLNSSSEGNDVAVPSECTRPKEVLQMCGLGKAENVNFPVPGEVQRTSEKKLWASSNYMCGEDCWCPRDSAEHDKWQDSETHSFLHADAPFSHSTDSLDAASAASSVTSGYESSNTITDHSWDSLSKKYESVLQDCLLGNRSIIKIKSLTRKLQRLQEKAVADDDYERADKFRRKLEELEKEKSSLTFQLPSRHPSISCFLDRFRVQVQVTLYGDVYRGSRQQKSEEKILSLPCQEKIKVSATKREQLVKEKEWIQKEIEVLRARLALLEAKDRQLQIEIQEQEQLIQAEDCELSSLLSWVSHQELQAIGKALADASDASHKIPHSLDFPESIKRLQEKEQSLSMAIKDTAGKICTSQKLCSILRRKVSDIETQLPALLEAKMLAVSGGNFCIAKDLAEEIKSLMAERDRLEKLLSEWSLLSSQNAQNLERMKESHKRLKEDMEQGQAAFENKLKKNTLKYMEVLEEKLQSSGSQLLERVWEVDLEACQLLIQGLQLKEGGCVSDEESQTDEVGDTADSSLSSEQEQSKHVPIKGGKRTALQCPIIQSKHQSTHWEPKEEFHILSTELKEKCETIREKLMHLEDQLHIAICSSDESLVHILFIFCV